MQNWFSEAIEGKDYFLITQFEELDRQPQVKQILNENYSVWKSTSDYLIYDLRNPLVK